MRKIVLKSINDEDAVIAITHMADETGGLLTVEFTLPVEKRPVINRIRRAFNVLLGREIVEQAVFLDKENQDRLFNMLKDNRAKTEAITKEQKQSTRRERGRRKDDRFGFGRRKG